MTAPLEDGDEEIVPVALIVALAPRTYRALGRLVATRVYGEDEGEVARRLIEECLIHAMADGIIGPDPY